MSKPLIPAVGYIRMSSDEQEASPAQQRAEIIALAAKLGYVIVRWYEDLGISGDATEKRKAFLQMVKDAEEKGDFCAILCWDQDRFGRFDSIEAGRWIHPLRQAGVWLVTVAQGQIDWNDFASRMIYTIHQEGKHQFLVDLSRNVLRGRLAAARAGKLLVGSAYGYDRVFYDERGEMVKRVPYGEKFSKPKNWTVRLSPSEDPQEREIVQWMFEEFSASDCSLRHLATTLNARGSFTRRGSPWNAVSIRYMLTNPAYVGHAVFGRRRTGKYHQIGINGDLLEIKGKAKVKASDGEPVTIENTHEALVSREAFERVQEKLSGNVNQKTRPRSGEYILSGILRCGHCGKPMCGKASQHRDKTVLKYYYCPGIHNGTCKSHAIRKEQIDHYIMGVVGGLLNSPESIETITRVAHRVGQTAPKFQENAKSLQAKIDTLDRKIAKGNENILLADAGAIPELSKLLASWRKERTDAQEALEGLAANPTGQTQDEAVKSVLERLKRLQAKFRSADPMKIRAAIKALVDNVELWWEPRGKRYQRLARGVLTWRSSREVLKSTSNTASARRPRENGGL